MEIFDSLSLSSFLHVLAMFAGSTLLGGDIASALAGNVPSLVQSLLPVLAGVFGLVFGYKSRPTTD